MNPPTPAHEAAAAVPLVAAIPTLNEAAHVGQLIVDLLQDGAFADGGQLWVLDGGSTDGTREVVARLAETDPRVRLIDNPKRNQAAALNLAAQLAAGLGTTILVRIDAHSRYPAGFVSGLVRTLQAEDCDSVVVPMRTVGGDPMRDAAADLFNSWLGNGGSPHRSGRVRGYVDHGHHAAFKLSTFLRVGGYDTRFVANEDAELDKRIRASGGRIFLDNELSIAYVPRATLPALWRQMWRNGRYRVWTARKHREVLSARQLLPIAASVGFAGSVALGAVWRPLALPAAAYLLGVAAASTYVAGRRAPGHVSRVAAQAVTSHLAFGFGALRGALDDLTPLVAITGASKRTINQQRT